MAKSERQSAFTGNRSRTVEKMLESVEAQTEPQTSGQGKPAHAGQRGQDKAGRQKATYDVSLTTQAIIREIAEAEECHIGDIVEIALRYFAAAHQAGRVDLTPFKAPTRSLKAIWTLELPAEIDFFSD